MFTGKRLRFVQNGNVLRNIKIVECLLHLQVSTNNQLFKSLKKSVQNSNFKFIFISTNLGTEKCEIAFLFDNIFIQRLQSDTVNVTQVLYNQVTLHDHVRKSHIGKEGLVGFGSVEITLQRVIHESLGSDVFLYNNLKWHSDIDVDRLLYRFGPILTAEFGKLDTVDITNMGCVRREIAIGLHLGVDSQTWWIQQTDDINAIQSSVVHYLTGVSQRGLFQIEHHLVQLASRLRQCKQSRQHLVR